jgi:hypothetical protein
LRVRGIFTPIAISPSSSLRQCPSRYTIRAGRNLPDKGFRYLRTVIVTAAVHRGFGSKLRACALTSLLNLPALGRYQPLYLSFRFGRDLCLCYTVAWAGFVPPPCGGPPYSEVTYPHLPVSVCGTGTSLFSNEVFLDSVDSTELSRVAPQFLPPLSLTSRWICLPQHASGWERTVSIGHAQPILLCLPFAVAIVRWYGNIDPLSIAFPLRV